MKGLSALKDVLHEAKHLSQLEPGVFMAPFLEIIRSEETTGPVTSLALSAVSKIISYGLIGKLILINFFSLNSIICRIKTILLIVYFI